MVPECPFLGDDMAPPLAPGCVPSFEDLQPIFVNLLC
jgi:hypothetical protein